MQFLILLGLNDRAEERKFKWVDGTKENLHGFKWLTNEPGNSFPGEDCVEMFVRSNHNLWNDVPCSKELPFVCQVCSLSIALSFIAVTRKVFGRILIQTQTTGSARKIYCHCIIIMFRHFTL